MLLITTAVKHEVADFKRHLTVDLEVNLFPCRFFRGYLGHRQIGLLLTSICPSTGALTAALDSVCATSPIDRVVLTGFAGALAPEMQAGELVLASHVLKEGEIVPGGIACSERDRATVRQRLASLSIPWREGIGVTCDHPLLLHQEKTAMATASGAIMVDMENATIATLLHARGIPFAVVRSIFDPLELRFPQSLYGLVDAEGALQPKAGLDLVVKTPKDLLKLPQFARNSQKARRAIAKFLLALVVA